MMIDRGQDETIIHDDWQGFAYAKCVIGKTGSDNGDADFSLIIKDGGQIEKECDFKIYGPIERGFLLNFLKQIVIEIELLDK